MGHRTTSRNSGSAGQRAGRERTGFDHMAKREVQTSATRPGPVWPGLPKLGCVADTTIDRGTVAAPCPGCGLLVHVWTEELAPQDEPATREVLCAFCGNVTSLPHL